MLLLFVCLLFVVFKLEKCFQNAWLTAWLLANIFCKYLVKKNSKYFFQFLKKYFQKIFSIPFRNRETKCHHMALIKTWFKEFFFNIQKKFCVSRSLSNISKNGLGMVVRLNFDITHLSPPSTLNGILVVSYNLPE